LVIRQNRWSTVVRVTLKYDDPRLKNLGSSYFSVTHSLPCIICILSQKALFCCRCLQIFRFCASPHSQMTASAGALFVGTFLFDKAGLAGAAIFIPWANMRQLLHRQCTVSTFITLRDRLALTPRQTVAIKHHARPRQLPTCHNARRCIYSILIWR